MVNFEAKAIVQGLRISKFHDDGSEMTFNEWMSKEYATEKAADLIEELAAKVEEYETQITTMEAQTAELEQVKRKLDAALTDIKITKSCRICKHEDEGENSEICSTCLYWCGVNNFEWRGPCAKNGGATDA